MYYTWQVLRILMKPRAASQVPSQPPRFSPRLLGSMKPHLEKPLSGINSVAVTLPWQDSVTASFA